MFPFLLALNHMRQSFLHLSYCHCHRILICRQGLPHTDVCVGVGTRARVCVRAHVCVCVCVGDVGLHPLLVCFRIF